MVDKQVKYIELIQKKNQLLKQIAKLNLSITKNTSSAAVEVNNNLVKGLDIAVEKLNGFKAKARAIDTYIRKIDESKKQLDDVEKEIKNLNITQSVIREFNSDHNFMLTPVKLQAKFVTIKHIHKLQKTNNLVAKPVIINEGLRQKFPKDNLQTYHGFLPVANFPIPNETSYPLIKDGHELWIRIYPDDIHTQTHETRMSRKEIDIAKKFYRSIRANDISDEEIEQIKLTAWKTVVGSLGTTRALYVLDQYKPTNKKGVPKFKNIPDLELKDKSWSKPPMAKGLPDQFVIRTYGHNKGSQQVQDFECKPLPLENGEPCLHIGLDPASSKEGTPFKITGTGIEVDKRLKWLTDFDRAVEVGMGIRIPITEEQAKNGFSKIIALGIRKEKDVIKNKNHIEELFKNHVYKPGGTSLLKIGTPTNNTDETKSAQGIDDLSLEDSFKLLNQEITQEKVLGGFLKKASDAQRLAVSLGIAPDCLKHALNLDNTEISQAVGFNLALSFGTFGYGISTFFDDYFEGIEDLQGARHIFNHFISGRGLLPTLRIGSQPYGFLPISRYSKLSFFKNDPLWKNPLISQLIKLLPQLWDDWNVATNSILKVSEDDNKSNPFLKFLATRSTSQNMFYTGWSSFESIHDQISQNLHDSTFIKQYNNHILKESAKGLGYTKGSQNYGPPIDLKFLTQWDSKVLENKLVPLDEIDYLEFFSKHLHYHRFKTHVNTADLSKMGGEPGYYDTPLKESFKHVHAPLLLLYLRFTILRAGRFDFFDKDANLQNIALHDRDIISEKTSTQQILNDKWLRKNVTILRTFLDKDLSVFKQKLQGSNDVLKTNLNQLSSTIKSSLQTQNKIDISKTPKMVDLLTNANVTLPNANGKDYFLLSEIDLGLAMIKNLPKENVHLLFMEHLDTLSHRVDSWFSGLTYYKLLRKRKDFQVDIPQMFSGGFGSPAKHIDPSLGGLFYGAYGYIEDIGKDRIKDENGRFSEEFLFRELDADELHSDANIDVAPFLPPSDMRLGDIWIYLGTSSTQNFDGKLNFYDRVEVSKGKLTLTAKPAKDNAGFIPAPSLDHARTAAVLRSGYQNQVKQHNNDNSEIPFATNLSSRRIRESLFYLSGLQNGQELNHLIGYRFERALKEAKFGLERYIPYFRRAFPLRRESLEKNEKSFQVEHVTNGITLIEELKKKTIAEFLRKVFSTPKKGMLDFSFWKDVSTEVNGNALLRKSGHDEEIINIVKNIRNELDGLNDLLVAEGMFQISRGNIDRAAAALKLISENGEVTTMPQIQEMPRSGFPITHSVGFILDKTKMKYKWDAEQSPLSRLCPQINYWLSYNLPNPEMICVNLKWKKQFESKEWSKKTVRITDLNLQPIDFVYMICDGGKGFTGSELIFRAEKYILGLAEFKDLEFLGHNVQLDIPTDKLNSKKDEFAFQEIYPLIDTLYQILTESRALEAKDFSTLIKERESEKPLNEKIEDFQDYSIAIKTIRQTKKSLEKVSDEIEVLLEDVLTQSNVTSKSSLAIAKKLILDISRFRITDAVPQSHQFLTDAKKLYHHFSKILNKIRKRCVKAAGISSDPMELKGNLEILEILLGRGVQIIPSVGDLTHLISKSPRTEDLLDKENPFEIEEWLQSLAPVRPKIGLFQRWNQLTSFVGKASVKDRIYQFPLRKEPKSDYWFGMRFNKEDFLDNGNRNDIFSFLFSSLGNPSNITKEAYGLILDQWMEQIPDKTRDLAVAMNYDQPSNEPPQNILLSVSGSEDGFWDWEDLIGSVEETFDLAKMRLVGPKQIPEKYKKYLPLLVVPQYIKESVLRQPKLASMIPGNSLPFDAKNQQI